MECEFGKSGQKLAFALFPRPPAGALIKWHWISRWTLRPNMSPL
jgi:hypothetical protein